MDLCQVHLGDLQMVEGIPAALPSLPRWDSCTGRTLLISPCHPLLYPNWLISALVLLAVRECNEGNRRRNTHNPEPGGEFTRPLRKRKYGQRRV